MWRQGMKKRLEAAEGEISESLERTAADDQQTVLIKEEGPEEQMPDVDQQEMELVIIKDEEQELWTSVEGQQLDADEETDATMFPLTAVSLKIEEDEEKPRPQQHIEKIDLPTSSSADQMETETGGGRETTRNQGLNTHGGDSSFPETEVNDHDEDMVENHFDCQLKGSSDFETTTEDWKESESPGSGVNSVNKSFSCSECGQQFLHTWPLQRRMASHLGVKCSSCLVNKKYVGVKKTVQSATRDKMTPKSFSCDDCGKRFTRKTDLNTHMRIHTGQETFVCDVCERRFSYKSRLNAHMRIHTGDQPFVCDVCGQRCSGKAHLNRHMSVHTGQKPFACDFCELRFSQRGSLNIHMRIHTGQKPFACDVCERQFSQKTDLNRHVRIHTGDKPFVCRVCGRQFNQKGNLNTHMRIHTENKQKLICSDS